MISYARGCSRKSKVGNLKYIENCLIWIIVNCWWMSRNSLLINNLVSGPPLAACGLCFPHHNRSLLKAWPMGAQGNQFSGQSLPATLSPTNNSVSRHHSARKLLQPEDHRGHSKFSSPQYFIWIIFNFLVNDQEFFIHQQQQNFKCS